MSCDNRGRRRRTQGGRGTESRDSPSCYRVHWRMSTECAHIQLQTMCAVVHAALWDMWQHKQVSQPWAELMQQGHSRSGWSMELASWIIPQTPRCCSTCAISTTTPMQHPSLATTPQLRLAVSGPR
jgi:hypothetical protein